MGRIISLDCPGDGTAGNHAAEAVDYVWIVNFDDLTSTSVKYTLAGFGKTTGGGPSPTHDVNLRVGGTLAGIDGTIVATAHYSGTTVFDNTTQFYTTATVTRTTGTQFVRVTSVSGNPGTHGIQLLSCAVLIIEV